MKNLKHLSFLLCIVLALQCLLLPVSAAEEGETAGPTLPPAVVGGVTNEDREDTFGTVSIQNGCRTINGMAPLGSSERKLDTAQSVFLYEVNTDTVVYSYNPDVEMAPGNLAKMVTSLLALEMCGLDDVVTASSRYISKLPAQTQHQNLKEGEKLTVEDLVHCMMLASANDAAIAVAEHISGTQEAFVELMNQRVRQMGCSNTVFANVHGLDNAAAHTTARDMAKITLAALENQDFARIFSEDEYTVPATERSKERVLKTADYMISQSVIPDFYDKFVIGGIQGASNAGGASMVCLREEKGMKFLGVVMGCLRVMDEKESWRVRTYGNFEEMTELFDYAYKSYKINHILYNGMTLKQFQVSGGESNAVGQVKVDQNTVVPVNANMDNLSLKFFIGKDGLKAPIAQGEKIGTMEIWYRNSCMAEAEMFSMGNVKAAKDTGVTIHSAAVRSDSDASGFLSVLGTICVIVLGLAMAYLAFNAYMRSRVRARRRRRREARRRAR